MKCYFNSFVHVYNHNKKDSAFEKPLPNHFYPQDGGIGPNASVAWVRPVGVETVTMDGAGYPLKRQEAD